MGTSPVDVAIVGAGPVGVATALAHAKRGARVALLEARPNASRRLAGEWLHPPAREALEALGVGVPESASHHDSGRGFVVFPDDGGDPMVLPYNTGHRGLCCEHHELVDAMRAVAEADPRIAYLPGAKVTAVADGSLTYERKGQPGSTRVPAGLIVGADGRASIVRKALGFDTAHVTVSRMAGLVLEDVAVPFEGHGHVFLGGPGPILMYRMGQRRVRLILDVPLGRLRERSQPAWLWEAYAPRLPAALRPAFRDALAAGVQWAANKVRPRHDYGRDGMVLVGDAVGHHHPLTAIGMTLGFQDALSLAQGKSFASWQRRRRRATRVPEMLAVALFDVFSDDAPESLAIRNAVFALWRNSAAERRRTMGYLECRDVRLAAFGGSFARAVTHALRHVGTRAARTGQWRHGGQTVRDLGGRMRWLVEGVLHIAPATGRDGMVLGTTKPAAQTMRRVDAARPAIAAAPLEDAVKRGVDALAAVQNADGSWEGEVIWCAMLPAQYTIAAHVSGRALSAARRAGLIRQLQHTQLADGTWGLHPHSQGYLFTTTLSYVAARLLGVSADAAWLTRPRDFIGAQGGPELTPSWGKFWLALAGVLDWSAVPPTIPEAWRLPRWLFAHPGRYYCHTRLIYMAMATLSGRRLTGPPSATVEALRRELAPLPGAPRPTRRWDVRKADLHTPHTPALRAAYHLASVVDRVHRPAARARLLGELGERIRWELRTTDHTSISPVSGLLNILALWAADPDDTDVARAWERFEGWVWEDDTAGTRVAGARSGSWDTAFALQALAEARPVVDGAADHAIARGTAFLLANQIRETFPGYAEHDRVDPNGGWCFAGGWHGWPVSDCTAEAFTALDAVGAQGFDTSRADDAARFILQTQNRDGGFGSYEAKKGRIDLEWLNPAEMFGDSMTEHAYVECTASCVEALAAYVRRRPTGPHAVAARDAIDRAADWLRRAQRPDGSWRGVWGVCFIYGTLFGLRGLRAAGAPAWDPAVRQGARWLASAQRPDGAWGEHHESCLQDRYLPHADGQIVQTAWALMGLALSNASVGGEIDHGAAWLADQQQADGTWPRTDDMSGVFFHTALLEYEHYVRFFPVAALALAARRKAAVHDVFAAPAPPSAQAATG